MCEAGNPELPCAPTLWAALCELAGQLLTTAPLGRFVAEDHLAERTGVSWAASQDAQSRRHFCPGLAQPHARRPCWNTHHSVPQTQLTFMSSKNSAGEDSTLTCELETPNSGTRFRIHWNLCTPSGHRQQGGEAAWGTAGDSKGASSSHGDLVQETHKGLHSTSWFHRSLS